MTYTGAEEVAAPAAPEEPSPFWTWPRVDRLEALWKLGHSASKIARQIGDGCTRNQVIGKAHRLGLAKRASPIIRHLGSTNATKGLKDWHCRYPHGHPGEPDFRFCGSPRDPESSYCPEHERATRIAGSSYENFERLRKRQSRKAA